MVDHLKLVVADQLERAVKEHGGWNWFQRSKAANIALGGLRQVAVVLDPSTKELGNEETIAKLRSK